jgi:uncharacterized membrane protein YjfL (UPF0719 family)
MTLHVMFAMTEPQTDRLIQAVDSLASNLAAQSAHPPLLNGLALTGVYSIAGVIIAIIAYKLFDLCTPGQLHKEIVENKNVAAALVGGSIIIGVCIVVAAAIMG